MHPDASPQSWSARLWQPIEPIFASILAHPFLTGLVDGSLDDKAFAHYVAQDVHYLRDYARALAIVAAKAPTLADTAMFSRHAAEVFAVELGLHSELLPQLGLELEALNAVPIAPTTRAYTSYLLATAYSGTFAEGLAAVLPCYWIYARVGAALLERGSLDRRYQRWIDSYGGEEYAATVAEVLDLTDRLGPTLSVADEASARAHFGVTAKYEWMFFDAAYRREQWPV
ncbi:MULTISPECIES: thiaminase II [unclassified Mycolicibacterium]|uniref:thiaminase II n=1 Tax=unclassified Mycolicibacterium TaxID=2636767 RepID=UPI0012DD3D4F|nr:MULTISPECIES: thiaminase II [unclassified Mycolicibacterium]MUL85573.1 thiaminase II [Mycolicibacterium sp. CBMA 329]MUL88663.1 thiaminase II [Mycolicibacterium sp. CBMA 331]MUM02042.1 thiaminase II [Mycolicibacterium sp. CBMA 334]MUM26945.1 thiaminase II [Mycolicibacterium sp. CBMA 295]MUM40310.1 thiaminase II [Mycolicibacterium sp. CBMA 247]